MKIIILGAGRVGTSMADILVSEANDVTLVDLDARHLRTLQDRLDIRTVVGGAAFPSVLEQAGGEDADLLVAVTNSDEVNMVACQVAAAKFATPTKIARIRSSDYLSFPELFQSDAIPIDVLISPEEIITNHVTKLIEYPGALQVLDFAGGKIQLVGVRAYHGGPLVGHPLQEIRQHMPKIDTRVAAIYRRDAVVIPEADTIIQPDDEVFFIAAKQHIKSVMNEMRLPDKSVTRVMLAGGGNIGYRLARQLERKSYSVKIIECKHERAEFIADGLDGVVVLHGDAADEELL
ncbi:MAG: Trk system potassium transporter TrkA, partial [Gammaproteobacteria bacterium]|nr:Trk system potassium transporter TrkA [Gammaproteobacteria bacterium]